ncbi:MAG: hypothetical protein F4217_08105 [Acidimicrobiaceae bacterium]|nr:hypothetical protein [Acidimicrobiaceae bacterium]
MDLAVVAVVAGASFGVFGTGPQHESQRLIEAVETWYDRASELSARALGAEQPVCEPVPVVPGASPPTVLLEPMMYQPNAFRVTVSEAECAWVDFNLVRGPDLHHLWEFQTLSPKVRVEQVWAAHTMTAPFTLTAVGPGGVAVTEGELQFQQS